MLTGAAEMLLRFAASTGRGGSALHPAAKSSLVWVDCTPTAQQALCPAVHLPSCWLTRA